jgi:hypothetical protein
MQQIDRLRQERGEIEIPPSDSGGIELDEIGLRYSRAGCRQQRHPVAQLHEPTCQPDYYPLGSPVTANGKTAVGVEGDMHRAAMYRPHFTRAKGSEE